MCLNKNTLSTKGQKKNPITPSVVRAHFHVFFIDTYIEKTQFCAKVHAQLVAQQTETTLCIYSLRATHK